jgi:hypothetical protein
MKIEFTIDNKNNRPSKVVLLGSNYNMFRNNFGSDAGVDIECLINDFEKLDYLKMLHQLQNRPSWIQSVKYESYYTKNKELFINYVHTDANGTVRQIPKTLNRNKWDDIPIIFDGNTSIEFQIPENSKIMFIVDDGKSQFAKTKNDKRKLILK